MKAERRERETREGWRNHEGESEERRGVGVMDEVTHVPVL